MSTVILAEKPSQARDIAAVIGIANKHNGYLELRDGSCITWALGHLLEQVQPDQYDPAWGGRWNWGQLPMLPTAWKLAVVKGRNDQLKVIKTLLKSATRVVIATDAGREGELIARELLDYCRYRGAIERLWTSSLVADDIRKALHSLRAGKETEPLYEAALARQRADYLVGMNGSRAATLAANRFREWFPVGRVQTPTLALVVRRDLAIRDFKAQTYYELEARVQAKSGELTMWHAPDAEHRILERGVAEALAVQARGGRGPLQVHKTAGKEGPPAPFTLPALQQEANRNLGLSARRTLEVAQSLYEQKAITYPRTDCEYLADSQRLEVPETLAVLDKTLPRLTGTVRAFPPVLRASVFNDAKLTDHHAIVPTRQFVTLTGVELQLFQLIALRYLQVLSPDALFERTKVALNANGVPFTATGKAYTQHGWRGLSLQSA